MQPHQETYTGKDGLLKRITNLLQRFGTLAKPPELADSSALGTTVLARFEAPESATRCVETLHGTDLRTNEEKARAGYAPAKLVPSPLLGTQQFCFALLTSFPGPL